MEYNIESGVEMPRQRIPFGSMEVGDSVVVPMEKRGSAQSQASRIKRTTGKTFTMKRIENNKVRIWRIT